jgi:hypothetical protein
VTAVGLNQDNNPGGPFDAVMTSAVWQDDVLVQTHDAYNNSHLPTGVHTLGTESALVGGDCNSQDPVGSVTLLRNDAAEPVEVGARDNLRSDSASVRSGGAWRGEVLVSGEDGASPEHCVGRQRGDIAGEQGGGDRVHRVVRGQESRVV